jgi:allantoin racemase
MKIDILIPVALTEDWIKVAVKRYAKHAMPDTIFQGRDMTGLNVQRMGSEEALLSIARKAAEEGANACIINCFTDPGLEMCADQIKIPVIGVGQAGMLLAKISGARFAVITTEESIVGLIEQNASRYGVADSLHVVAAIGMPFDEVPKHKEKALKQLTEIGLALLPKVDTFVLGCTELAEMARPLCHSLSDKQPGVKVINPLRAATHFAQDLSLADCNLT